jgi:mRNA interferase RelE/StbE
MPMNQRWTIEFTNTAQRVLDKMRDKRLLSRLNAMITQLETEPRPPGCVKLSGYHNLWRIRVGGWRITYSIRDDQLVIIVIEIEPRGSAYRNL